MADRFKQFRRYAADLLMAEQVRRPISSSGPTPLALVYPNYYAVGMASLGYQTVYRLFNEAPIFACERAFLQEGSFASFVRTLETQRPLRSFPIVAFSVAYEPDYLHVLHLLRLSGIPLRADQRTPLDPLILVGGVTMFSNPAVLAPVADVIFLGEAESLVPVFSRHFERHPRKDELLDGLGREPGFYIPSLQQETPLQVQHWPIHAQEPATSFCIPQQAHLRMFMIEVGRGCGRGCRFCSAGHVYHPFRQWPVDKIVDTVHAYARPGDRIGLVGAALSDYKDLDHLCSRLLDSGYPISLSSLRMDRITATLLRTMEKSGLDRITLAPEAGSERLRCVIGKNLSEDKILSAADLLAQSGIRLIKVYYMIGLPFETPEDIEAIILLTQRVAAHLPHRQLRVGLSQFIPKPCTPFQWAAVEDEKTIKQKWKTLASRLRRIPGVSVSSMNPREDRIQALLSLGDRELGMRLAELEQPLLWRGEKETLGRAQKTRDYADALPWDFIDCGQRKEGLWKGWLNAKMHAENG